MLSLRRRLATSITPSAAFFARTTVAPSTPISIPLNLQPKSVLILATPQNLSATIESAINLNQNENLQVVVAGVERVVPNGVDNGVSELWMNELMKIGDSVLLSEKDKPAPLRESDGVHPVGAKVNWKNVKASLELNLKEMSLSLPLANTAFYTSLLSTLFYFQPKELVTAGSSVGQTLCGLTVTLPNLEPLLNKATIYDNWTALSTSEEPLVVTKCTGNLLKGVNKLPASLFLEKNTKLMSLASKETKVYVKIYDKLGVCKRYEVIAGGGGWGAKADLLALSPEAKLSIGDRVEFFMVAPQDQGKMNTAVVSNQFLFECAAEAKAYGEKSLSTQTVENLFGCGSESGFVAANVQHTSPGESLSMSYN